MAADVMTKGEAFFFKSAGKHSTSAVSELSSTVVQVAVECAITKDCSFLSLARFDFTGLVRGIRK
jgi:hypothetical protein